MPAFHFTSRRRTLIRFSALAATVLTGLRGPGTNLAQQAGQLGSAFPAWWYHRCAGTRLG